LRLLLRRWCPQEWSTWHTSKVALAWLLLIQPRGKSWDWGGRKGR
jgi:hypothetical protein